MRKSVRHRMKGWRLKRFLERRRYCVLKAKVRRKRQTRRKNFSKHNIFEIKPEESGLVSIASGRSRKLNVGNTLVNCAQGSLILTPPRIFDFSKNYSESARFIAVFRRALEAGRKISYINFEDLEEISPACMMVFTAYADMWKLFAPNIRTKTQTWHPHIARQFSEIGFFEKLGFAEPNVKHGEETLRYMPIRSCYVNPFSQTDIGAEAGRLQEDIEHFIGRDLSDVRMYDSVTEAIYNVRGHAYKGMRVGHLPFKWWISVSVDDKRNELNVIIFDHGLGIPSTIKTSTKFSRYHRIITSWSESERLYLAFERERRKSGEVRSLIEGRGHGCPDIARLVSPEDENMVKPGSELSVFSGKGEYRLSGIGAHTRGVRSELPVKLQGTLIEWRIVL